MARWRGMVYLLAFMIRLCRVSDLPALRLLARTFTLPPVLAAGEMAWVMERQGEVVGYAVVTAAPGLAGVADLSGFIASGWQRRGLGQELLGFVCRQARRRGFAQLSCALPALDMPAALFLNRCGFYLEHEERRLALRDLSGLPPVRLPPLFTLSALPLPAAVRQFRLLYDACFGPHPWYQPYQDDAEVLAEMQETYSDLTDLLFLRHEGQPVGFAWVRRMPAAAGEIEPIGILPSFQGKGLGRSLLLYALRRLYEQGSQTAQIAAWSQNLPALHLYESVGFQPSASLFYLAHDLKNSTSARS